MNWRFKIIDYTTNPLGVETTVPEPQGWENISLNIRRDEEMHGVFFEFASNELVFYGEGMTIIRDAYNGYGVEANCVLIVEESCDDLNYNTFYEGKMVFDSYKETIADLCSVSIRTEQSDVVRTFQNRIDTPVDLGSTTSLDGSTLDSYTNLPKLTYLPSKGLYKQLYRIADYKALDGSCRLVKKQVPNGFGRQVVYNDMYWYWDCENAQTDEVKNWSAVDNWDLYKNTFSTMVMEDDGTYNIDFRVKGTMLAGAHCDGQAFGAPGYMSGFNDWTLDVIFNINGIETIVGSYSDTSSLCLNDLGAELSCSPFYNPATGGLDILNANIPQIAVDTTYTTTLSLVSGDVISLYMKVTQRGDYYKDSIYYYDVYWGQRFYKAVGTYFKINSINYKPTTTCDTFLVNESLARTTESITDNKMSVYSEYFGRTDSQPYPLGEDGCGSLESITNGLLIREQSIGGNTPQLNISFRDLFTGLNCIHNIGIGLEDDNYGGNRDKIVRVEPVEYFYDKNTVILTCDEVFSITKSTLPNRIYSDIEAGYAKYESEDITGIDEFLSKREYRTEWKNSKNKDSRVCNFIASGYALEVTRRKGHLTTSDWRLDNDIFIICMKRYLGDIVVEQGQISSEVNIIDPDTVYNFAISPIRNAMRWLKTWFAGVKNPYLAKLIFVNGTGNYYAGGEYTQQCTNDNQVIVENEALESAMLLNPDIVLPLWNPEQVQFDYPLSMTDYNALKGNPYGVIEYTHNTSVGYGYILNIDYKPNQGIATFTLLTANI